MKTTIIRHLLFAGVVSLVTFSSRSQSTSAQTAFAGVNPSVETNIYSNAEFSTLKNYVKSKKANRKIARYLSNHVEKTDNIILEKVDKNVLAVYFAGDIKNKILFDKNVNLVYTIVYSNEKLLPQNYKEMVDNLYVDYKISQVAKVNEAAREIWVLKLETPGRFLTVRIENNQLEEVKKFQKSRY